MEERSAAADRAIGKIADGKAGEKPEEKPAEAPKVEGEKKPDAKPDGASVELPAAAKTALGALLVAGNLTELAKQVGVDAKAVDASGKKLMLVRENVSKASTLLAQATEKETTAKTIREDCKREFGDPHRARKAVSEGKFAEAAQWIEKALDIPFAEFTRHVATATKGMDPKELERFTKDRELRDREKALEAKEKAKVEELSREQQTAKATKTIVAKCAGHAVLKLRDGAKLVLRKLEDAFDDKTGVVGLGYSQAADQVLAEFDESARALGYTKGAAAPEVKPEVKPEEKPRGKVEFQQPAGDKKNEEPAGSKRRGSSFEERTAKAARAYERSRAL